MSRRANTSGSALIVVIGIVAILTMMTVAFSVFVRTERSGATNFRNAVVAKHALYSARAMAMEAIDQTFENPANRWSVPNWEVNVGTSNLPSPFIASKTEWPFFQARLHTTDPAPAKQSAKILTEEMSRYFSPEQLAVIRNAVVEWVPLRSAVSAKRSYDQFGIRPADPIVGRYAFIVLNNTGYLDMNLTGGLNTDRNSADGMTNVNSIVLDNAAMIEPTQLTPSAKRFYDKRDAAGVFTSYAVLVDGYDKNDTWLYANYKNDRKSLNEGKANKEKLKDGDEFPPNIFATFSTALESLSPDGSPKTVIRPVPDDADKEKILATFIAMFKEAGQDGERYEFFKGALGTQFYPYSRARLATQALLDYIDEDFTSANAAVGIPKVGDDNAYRSTDPRDLPCTESVPLISSFGAFITGISDPVENPNADPANLSSWYREYTIDYTVTCSAQYHGTTDISSETFTLEVEWEKEQRTDDPFFSQAFKKAGGGALFGDPLAALQGTPAAGTPGSRDWSEINNTFFTGSESTSGTVSLNNERTRILFLKHDGTFKVKIYASSVTTAGGVSTATYPALSKFEEDNEQNDVYCVLRMKAKITHPTYGVVHQVPAERLNAADYNSSYPVTVAVGIHPNPNKASPGDPGYARGWALCADPRFAFDTSSLYANNMPAHFFWMNNFLDVFGSLGTATGAKQQVWNELDNFMWQGALAPTFEINPYAKLLVGENQNKIDAAVNASEACMGGNFYPDTLHSYAKNSLSPNIISKAFPFTFWRVVQSKVANAPLTSIGELGNLMIGPWETISLFNTYRPKDGKAEFHKVLDYFTLHEPRKEEYDGEHYPAVLAGRVNLNPPIPIDAKVTGQTVFGVPSANRKYNAAPFVSVLSGIKLNDAKPTGLRPIHATNVFNALYYDTVHDAGGIRRLSALGNVTNPSDADAYNSVINALAEMALDYQQELDIQTDEHREALIVKTAEMFTTRQQIFTVILRADAFAPKYGSDDAGDGTTLSSTRAIIELWRDPEPTRQGSGTGAHNWYIRSMRIF